MKKRSTIRRRHADTYLGLGVLTVIVVAFTVSWRLGLLAVAACLLIAAVGAYSPGERPDDERRP